LGGHAKGGETVKKGGEIMSAYIYCPKCGENSLNVDTLSCDECGYSSEFASTPQRSCKNCKHSEDGKPVDKKIMVTACQFCMRNQPYPDNWEAQ